MAEKESGSSLAAFLVGSALGIAAGILLAPRTGKESRQRLQKWAEGLRGRGEELMEEGRDLWRKGREKFEEQAERVKDSAEAAARKWDKG
jgi:gas vesicle protein